MPHRLTWLRDTLIELGATHGAAGAIGDAPPVPAAFQSNCLCGFKGEDRDTFLAHLADEIIDLIAHHFQILEFDQSWQTVYGCNEPDCREQGIDSDLHQHQHRGLRVELREKVARPIVGRELPDGTSQRSEGRV